MQPGCLRGSSIVTSRSGVYFFAEAMTFSSFKSGFKCGIEISTSKFKTNLFSRKRVDCFAWIRDAILLQVEGFLCVINRQIGAAPAVMRTLH